MSGKLEPDSRIKLGPRAPVWYRLSRRFFTLCAHVLFQVTLNGQANVPSGNYIVIANHLSWIDPFLLMIALPPEPRLYFVGAQQAVNRGWKARLMRRFDMLIPFERGATWVGKEMLKKSLEVLRAGGVLGIFPEGTLGPQEGDLLPLQRGIGHLVLKGGCPVVPVALSGVKELYLRKPVTIAIGKPFCIASAGEDRHVQVDAAVERVTSELRMLVPRYQEHKPAIKLFRRLTNLLG